MEKLSLRFTIFGKSNRSLVLAIEFSSNRIYSPISCLRSKMKDRDTRNIVEPKLERERRKEPIGRTEESD